MTKDKAKHDKFKQQVNRWRRARYTPASTDLVPRTALTCRKSQVGAVSLSTTREKVVVVICLHNLHVQKIPPLWRRSRFCLCAGKERRQPTSWEREEEKKQGLRKTPYSSVFPRMRSARAVIITVNFRPEAVTRYRPATVARWSQLCSPGGVPNTIRSSSGSG